MPSNLRRKTPLPAIPDWFSQDDRAVVADIVELQRKIAVLDHDLDSYARGIIPKRSGVPFPAPYGYDMRDNRGGRIS